MFLYQNNRFSTIVSMLIIFATISSVAFSISVACMEPNGQVIIETDCQVFDSSKKNPNQPYEDFDHRQACVDIPLWQFSPKISKYVSSEIQSIISGTLDIISYLEFDEELKIVNTDYSLQLIAPFDQSHLAIVTTRLLL
jgi:hypothetical protein